MLEATSRYDETSSSVMSESEFGVRDDELSGDAGVWSDWESFEADFECFLVFEGIFRESKANCLTLVLLRSFLALNPCCRGFYDTTNFGTLPPTPKL